MIDAAERRGSSERGQRTGSLKAMQAIWLAKIACRGDPQPLSWYAACVCIMAQPSKPQNPNMITLGPTVQSSLPPNQL